MADPINSATPSKDPANDGSLYGTFVQVLKKFLQNTDDMLPVKVIAVSTDRTRVTVEPFIKVVSTSGQQVVRAQIASVPVFTLGGGGYVISFPVKSGDKGWIKANDRDISLFLQSYVDSPPNTARQHSFEDGLFIPDIMTTFTINTEDTDNAVFQSTDGTIRIAIGSNKVKITAPTVVIDSPHTTLTGDLNVTGNITGNGISLDSHVHSSVQSGPDDTGGPV